jgi:osmoprotectant transport system permease protein
VSNNSSEIIAATRQHIALTAYSVLFGLLIAVPLALIVRRYPRGRTSTLGLTGVIYTIPSLALFAILFPYLGLRPLTVIVGLTGYTLLILLRNVLTGLDGVPADVKEAARGMGFGSGRLFLRVELPLALPAILAGVRVATVSTVALVTVGFIVGNGGLGELLFEGLQRLYRPEIVTGAVLCVLLAFVADLLLLGVQRLLTPWARSGR